MHGTVRYGHKVNVFHYTIAFSAFTVSGIPWISSVLAGRYPKAWTNYLNYCIFKITFNDEKKTEGAPGFEPGTSRSAVECSTTELYPHVPSNCFTLNHISMRIYSSSTFHLVFTIRFDLQILHSNRVRTDSFALEPMRTGAEEN